MTYGILGAMPREVELIAAALTGAATQTVGGVQYVVGNYAGQKVVAGTAGIGKVNAAAATQVLVSVFGAERLIFSGIAGNLSDMLAVGDVVISDMVCHHDIDDVTLANTGLKAEEYMANTTLIALAQAACRKQGVHALVGKIATGEKFICDKLSKADIIGRCHPLCVEMEGAAFGQVAQKNGVPFVVIRAMSDNADEAAFEKLVVKQFDISEYCATASAIVLDMIRA